MHSHSRFVLISLLMIACTQPKVAPQGPDTASAGEDSTDPLCPSEEPAAPSSAVDVPVRYTITITGTDFSALVTSSFAFGLEHEDGDSFAPLSLTVGESADVSALMGWSSKVQGVVTACTDAGTGCAAAWSDQRAALTRTATLTMATDAGILATWTLDEVWPIEFAIAEQTTNDPIVSFTLSVHVSEFTMNAANPTAGGFAARWKAPELNASSDTHRGYLSPRDLRHALARQSTTGLHFSDDYAPVAFRVEVDGAIVGGFKEAHGLESDLVPVSYQNGGDLTVRKRPGKAKYKNIVLRAGAVSKPVIDWNKASAAETSTRKSGSLIYLDRASSAKRRYNFFEGWPNKLKSDQPTMHVHGDPHVDEKDGTRWDYVIEQIEIAVEKVERAR